MTDEPMHPGREARLSRAPRCGAKTRRGTRCQSPAVGGKARCRMHGGAKGSGGPSGSRNGNYRHGHYTAETMASRRWVREMTREVRASTKALRERTP
jgi:hypothetical protein